VSAKTEYYAEGLAESFDEHGIVATPEQIKAVASDVQGYADNIGMAFYTPPASDRYAQIEGEWRAKYERLQREF
jgi:hypothetical protein